MNSEDLHREIKNIAAWKEFTDATLYSAEKAAFLSMAHFIDLPTAECMGDFSVTSGTGSYDTTNTIDAPVGAVIDRVTSAVFVGSNTQQPLNEWGIRRWMYHFYGTASSSRGGTPHAFTLHNNQFHLWYQPDISGTVYFSAQRVLTDISDFSDNYFPLMLELTKLHLAAPGTWEAQQAWQLAKQLIKSFKEPMHPKKDTTEMSSHRAERVRRLNELY